MSGEQAMKSTRANEDMPLVNDMLRPDVASSTVNQVALPLSLKGLMFMLWAVSVGVSVSCRLWCSMVLTAAAGGNPYVSSFYITAIGCLLSAACLAPFSSLRSFPRGRSPVFASMCALPGALLIVDSKFLGLGRCQLLLKLSTLSTALGMDASSGVLQQGLMRRLSGAALVLVGVIIYLSTSGFKNGEGVSSIFSLLIYGCSIWAAGVGFVLQAWFATPARESTEDIRNADEVEMSTAMAVQLYGAVVQIVLVLVAYAVYPHAVSIRMDVRHCHLWLVVGVQGAAYLRSLQILTTEIGFASTFILSLCGQLCSATLIDASTGFAAVSNMRLAGLGVVIVGSVMGGLGNSGSVHEKTIRDRMDEQLNKYETGEIELQDQRKP